MNLNYKTLFVLAAGLCLSSGASAITVNMTDAVKSRHNVGITVNMTDAVKSRHNVGITVNLSDAVKSRHSVGATQNFEKSAQAKSTEIQESGKVLDLNEGF